MRFSSVIITLMLMKYSELTGTLLIPRFDPTTRRVVQQSRINDRRDVRAAVGNASTWLALRLDQELSKSNRDNNVIISPSCLQMALAMVLLATRGETSRQIATVLGSYDKTISGAEVLRYSNEIHNTLSQIFQSNDRQRGRDASLQIQHSSGIFLQTGYRMQEKYYDDSRRFYNSDVFSADFAGGGDVAQRSINSWVRDKTRGKIGKVLSSPPDASTKAMIISTLYFKGEWTQHFVELKEREQFKIQGGRTVEVVMLSATARYLFLDGKSGFKIIGLPYKGEEVRMYIILPRIAPNSKGGSDLQLLKSGLTPKNLNELIRRMTPQNVNVKIPKMKLSRSVSMKDAFRALGLINLFDSDLADFSGLLYTTRNNPSYSRLHVSDVVHAVEISVDKRGTEAGAAAAVSLIDRVADDPLEFHVNRPFIFFIRNEKTGSILFWGSIVNPR